MSKSLNNSLNFITLYIFLPIALGKLLWSFSLFFLEKGSIDEQKRVDYTYHYNINFANKMFSTSEIKPKPKIPKPTPIPTPWNSIKLKATYIDSLVKFIAIIKGKEIEFVSLDEDYKGYRVKEIEHNRALLERDGKTFYIVINEEKSKSKYPKQPIKPIPPKNNSPIKPQESFIVSRKDIEYFKKHPGAPWKSIKIRELRKNKKLDGFIVDGIKQGSLFSKIGLKKGDIIKSIDGQVIESLKNVMNYYNKIDTLEDLSLGVKRGQNEVELVFNIEE